jgi:flagellar biogenesis protein FliO
MPSLFTLLGTYLVMAATAQPEAAKPEPWWSNPPGAAAASSKPKVVEYGSTAAGSRSGATELAPDPPTSNRPKTPADFQPEPAGAVRTVVAEAPIDKVKPEDLESSAPARLLPPPSPRAEAAGPEPAAASGPVTSANAAPSPSKPAAGSTTPLSLGGHGEKGSPAKASPFSAMITVGGSLSIVLGLFLLVAWVMRKTAPRGSLVLPKEVFDVLGRAPLGARQQVQLLRCGNKLLLVSITPHGAETLTEVTDPLEVDRIAGICQQSHPKSSTAAFRQVFQQLAPKSGAPAEYEPSESVATRRKKYRWEENHA